MGALLDGYWLVYETQYSSSSGYNTYGIVWTNSRSGQSCEFVGGEPETNNPSLYCSGGDVYWAEFNYNNGMYDYDQPLVGAIEPTPQSGLHLYRMSQSTGHRNMFLNTFPITYPVGYEGEIFPDTWTPPPAKYVAMGDSFSSGEGNAPFESGTDTQDNECHRSEAAYPHWLNQTSGVHSGQMAFVACSGAETFHILNGQHNEPAQIDALSDEAELVTLTIGGNDIGFGDYAYACITSNCDSGSSIYAATVDKIHNELPGSMQGVVDAIALKTDTAEVFVVGYPYVTPPVELGDLPTQCFYLTQAEALSARTIVDKLNSEIEGAVADYTNTYSDTTFTFINPNMSVSGSFDGHDVCRGLDSYFHNVTPNDALPGGNGYREKIFHPNVYGQYEYYTILKGAVENS